jgi:hypothetical protein
MEKISWYTEKRIIKDLIPTQGNPRQLTAKEAEDLKKSFYSEIIKKLEWEFSIFMFDVFPPPITIVKAEEFNKKGHPKKVICKTTTKLPEGIKLDVFVEEEIDLGDGDKDIRKKEVGRLRITEVQSSKVVLCEVKDGAEEIGNNLNQKITMRCKVNFETSYLESLNPFKKKAGY